MAITIRYDRILETSYGLWMDDRARHAEDSKSAKSEERCIPRAHALCALSNGLLVSYALCWLPLAIAGIAADTPRVVVALFVFPAFGARGVATTTALHRAVTSTGAPGTAGKQAEALEILCCSQQEQTLQSRTSRASITQITRRMR